MTNSPSVALAYRKRRREGGPSTDQEVLWVRFPVAAGSSHTKDVKNGRGPYLHGTHDWSARCQYNVAGCVSMC